MTEIAEILRDGSLPAAELTARLGVSPATLMRRLREAGSAVVRIGRSHAVRYGLRRESAALGASEVPLFRVDEDGQPSPVGRLVFLSGAETAWLPGGVVFDGLPPEIADMRPSGFMGRAFAMRFPELPVPNRVDDWSDEHTITGIARRGEDLPGNMIVGDESLQRWYDNPPVASRRDDYPALADAATAGDVRGSSAGGERPKFGAYVDGRHVMVKYAGAGGQVEQRWQDLLAMEAIALDVLREAGHQASSAQLIDGPTHRFLEVERFDRVGERGRIAVMTLAAVHARATDDWAQAARQMQEESILSAQNARRLQLYESFGRLIANTDRHHYNIALFPQHAGEGEETSISARRFVLAPAFDQLPMLYAPASDGQLPQREFTRPAPSADTWDVWDEAVSLASQFWERAGGEPMISGDMRSVAHSNGRIIADG